MATKVFAAPDAPWAERARSVLNLPLTGDEGPVPPRYGAFQEAVARFVAEPKSTDRNREQIGDELVVFRRLLNVLELEFARRAGDFSYEPSNVEGCETDPTQWIRTECRMTTKAANDAVMLGRGIDDLPGVEDAVVSGRIGTSHAWWISWLVNNMRTSATATSTQFDFPALLHKAERLNVFHFRRHVEHLRHAMDEAGFLDEQGDGDHPSLTLRSHDGGGLYMYGHFDAEGAVVLRAVLDPLARRNGAGDHRSLDERHADALVEACNHVLESAELPVMNGQRPQVHVTTSMETLCELVGAPGGELSDGTVVHWSSVQRWACDASIVRLLRDPKGTIIDVGRSTRVIPIGLRRALAVRDRGCVWPGCNRPSNWTQGHHLQHWGRFGPTNLENTGLLCWRHHGDVHGADYLLVNTDDGWVIGRPYDIPDLLPVPFEPWIPPSLPEPASLPRAPAPSLAAG